MKRLLGLLLAASLSVPAAHAMNVGGVTLPDTIGIDGRTLVLNGAALRAVTFLQIRAYVIGLYLQHKSHDPATIVNSPGVKVLLLYYLHDGSKERVEKSFREGEDRACGTGGCPQADAADFDKLMRSFPAVKVGDTSAYIIDDRGVRATVNNKTIVTIHNQDVAHRLLQSFIGDHPPAPEVRTALLGLPNQ